MGYLAALDTELTPELIDEGLAREFVHRVQTMRKNAGFDIADYIAMSYMVPPGGRLARVLQRYWPYIAAETLTTQNAVIPAGEVAGHVESFTIDGEDVTVGVTIDLRTAMPHEPAAEQ